MVKQKVWKQYVPKVYSLNLLRWVELAMCPDSATVRPGVIKDRIKMWTEARKKELMLKAFTEAPAVDITTVKLTLKHRSPMMAEFSPCTMQKKQEPKFGILKIFYN